MHARALLAIVLAACGGPASQDDGGADTRASGPAPVAPREATAPQRALALGAADRVAVPEGVVLAGSRPGTPLRRPRVEADQAPIDVPAFEIDLGARRAADRADPEHVAVEVAAASCEARGGRLCDELEWERACEGDAHVALPTASGDFPACAADPARCVGALGLIAQGVLAPEWTRSGERFVLRGARLDQEAASHRCDARTVLDDTAGREGAVRCCYGPAPSLTYPAPRPGGAPFAPLEIDLPALRAAMRSTPELAPWADAFTPFDTAAAERAYTRADLAVDDTIRARLAAGPLVWSPIAGERVWLFAGESGEDSLIAVLYPLEGPQGAVVHGASFVFHGEHVPVAITPVPRERASVAWSTAIGRAGESGLVRLDDDGVIRIVAQ